MEDCKHERLNHVGEQKTDEGVNSYYTCAECGNLLVFTPARKMFSVPKVH